MTERLRAARWPLALVGANVFDAVSTVLALRIQGAIEGNPLVYVTIGALGVPAAMAVKVALGGLAAWWAWRRRRLRLLPLAVVWFAALGSWNIYRWVAA